MSGVSKDAMYDPDEAIKELLLQEQLVRQAVDIQALLRILVDKEIITKEEINKYRDEVSHSPKYAPTIEKIESFKKTFELAKVDPKSYLQALLKAKIEGKIK